MMRMSFPAGRHLFIFDPRIQGHHLPWLTYVCEDFLQAGFRLTLAVDLRPGSREMVYDHLGPLATEVNLVSVFGNNGRYLHGSKMAALVSCVRSSGADHIFLPNLDEIAPSCLRKAALGFFPPPELRGRMSGIYFRPRFLASSMWPPGNLLKGIGFERLSRSGWFEHVYFLDESLLDVARQRFPLTKSFFLPDTWSGNYHRDTTSARLRLGVPTDRVVVLHYGLGSRRKGLHLLVRALTESGMEKSGLYLLCVGQLAGDSEIAQGLAELERRGMARVINRHVGQVEEEESFAACDVVSLAYVDHFGSSGVLSRAAAAGKPVIASDQELLGRRVRQYGLGLLFASQNVSSLKSALLDMAGLSPEQRGQYQKAGQRYAATCDRASYRRALLAPFLGDNEIEFVI